MAQKTHLGGNEHILLVDDEVPVLIMTQKMLERIGYQVTIKRSSSEAFQVFLAQPENFDLVIIDFMMAEMTGDILARKVIQIRPDIPIILFTGNSGIISQEKASKSDFKDFLMKPFTIKDLTHIVSKVLDEKPIDTLNYFLDGFVDVFMPAGV